MAARRTAPPPPSINPAFDDSAHGAAFVPDEGGTTRARPVTRVPGAPAFLFKAHPNRWTVENGRLIPVLGKVKFIPGVGGCDADPRTGKPRIAPARMEAEEGGWTIVPFDRIPDAHAAPGQAKSYLRTVEGRPDLVISIYDKVYPGSDRIECDMPRWYEFCDYLVASGLINPPSSHVLRNMLDRLRAHRDARAAKAVTAPSVRAEVAQIEANIAVIEAELARRTEAPQAPAGGVAFNPEEAFHG